MIKTYHEFLAVVSGKCSLYEQIPGEHLSFEGSNVYDLYKAVKIVTCFASNASELLALLHDDEDVAFQAKYAGFEYGLITNCLERLAATERIPTA